MNNFIPELRPLVLPECNGCQEYLARWQGGVALHAKTAEELALANARLLDKDQEIRELRQGLAEAIASIHALGGKVDPKLQSLLGVPMPRRKPRALVRSLNRSEASVIQHPVTNIQQPCS